MNKVIQKICFIVLLFGVLNLSLASENDNQQVISTFKKNIRQADGATSSRCDRSVWKFQLGLMESGNESRAGFANEEK